MAERDHAAFARHLQEQVAVIGGARVFRGKAAVAAGWQRFFEAETAPFSWVPQQVEVSPEGQLAQSSGPVFDPTDKPIVRLNSIWRREAPGTWRIVCDKGKAWVEPPR